MRKVLLSRSRNPYFNQAIDSWLFKTHLPRQEILFLRRNNPVVVIGYHQNPYDECDLSAMKRENIDLLRRESGGGTVYQDLGNTNYSFLTSPATYSKENYDNYIISMLSSFGINAEATGRNDICTSGKKISGIARKHSATTVLHHGTLLLDVDMEKLRKCLTPNLEKLKSKSVKSVDQRVCNLHSLNMKITHDKVCFELQKLFNPDIIEKIDESLLLEHPLLNNEFNKLMDWNWTYGETLQFEYSLKNRFTWGSVDVKLDCKGGIIRNAVIFSDSLFPDEITDIMKQLKSTKLSVLDIDICLSEYIDTLHSDDCKSRMTEFKIWILNKMREITI